ncbi:Amino acid transporter avt1d [Thalictrum thalictroides]|uniref:Amino acid transporter avt1d n=1 Tax=Thalictrum thalictroides TaxID=46969 RepID=A0A7J6X7W4_THATH|nr:Amino acid transporter avt1d [Thalictrum thalictroides]
MKHEEGMVRDRGMEFETDDEENMAEGIAGGNEYDCEEGYTTSPNSSYNALPSPHSIPWPQSYRQSMDIYSSFTPPTASFLAGSSLGIGSSILCSSSPYRRSQVSVLDSSIRKPLLPPTTLDKEDQYSLPTPKHASIATSSNFDQPRRCSFTEAVLNGVNVLCGVALLSTPYAVNEGGWIGLLVLLTFCILSCYTGILLKRCLDSSPGLQTYPDIGQAAFGVTGRILIAIILYTELYACCVEYTILMSDNLSHLFPNVSMNFFGVHLNSHYVFAITVTLLVLPTLLLRNLTLLSYLSAGGVIATICVVICLLWVGVIDQVGFHPSGTALNLVNLPVALGIYGFCYSGHSVFPNIYSSMKEPSKFPAALLVSFVICFVLYAGVAILGFLMFGDATQSQITLNMPKYFLASKIAAWTTVVNPLSKFALTMTPVALSLEELWPSGQQKSHLVSVFIRTMLALSTLIVSLTIPFFSYVMALIGSFFAMLICLILPSACYLKIHRGRVGRFQTAVCIFIIIIGLTCGSIGSYSAIKKIVDSFIEMWKHWLVFSN